MWELINSLAKNKIKHSCAPSKLETNMGISSDVQLICETFNEFFSTIGAKLALKIQNSSSQVILNTNHYTEKLSDLEPCTRDEVSQIIKNRNSNTSTGIDSIIPKA